MDISIMRVIPGMAQPKARKVIVICFTMAEKSICKLYPVRPAQPLRAV
jgi:hypothetical protein